MGTWGVNLFQNDVAVETKEVYINSLKKGFTDEKAVETTKEELRDYCLNDSDSIDFWLALASVMFDYGRMDEITKNTALNIIDSGADMGRWEPKQLNRRNRVLLDLRNKLVSQMPDRKKVSLAKRIVPSIQPNDIYYLKIEQNLPIYILILVDSWVVYDLRIDGLGDQHPLVYIKLARELPEQVEDVDRMCIFDKNTPNLQKGIRNEDKRVMMCPEGFLQTKKKMIYLGTYNFEREKNVKSLLVNEKWIGETAYWDCLERDIAWMINNLSEAKILVN